MQLVAVGASRNEVAMLVVSRKLNEPIEIVPKEGACEITVGELFARETILVSLIRISPTRVQVAIEAPAELEIRRCKARDPDSQKNPADQTLPADRSS